MKVAIVHDYIKEYGGAERVLETLKEIYPHAHIYTLVYLPDFLGPHKERFIKWHVTPSFLQYMPFREKLISPFRLLAPIVFKTFNLSNYDVVITSATGSYNPNIVNKKSAKLICYCHTPPRFLYGYATARLMTNNKIIKFLASIGNHFLRIVDFRSSQNVDQFIANSNEVKSRIKKFYRKDAIVIYPPVEISNFKSPISSKKNRNYYVAGGRLARPKHIDLIVKAFTKEKLSLKVFGKSFAGYGDELQKIAGSTVQFLGEVTDEQKWELLRDAKAYLFASEDEDFGILPVEAMAAGTPVIAYRSGGVQETVIDGKTGIFFDKLTVDSIVSAVKKFNKTTISSTACQKRAEVFSKERFKREVQSVINAMI